MNKIKVKKVALYNPFWLGFGGGEKFVLSIGEYFLNRGVSVDLISIDSKEKTQNMIEESMKRFDLNLSGVGVINSSNNPSGKLNEKLGLYPFLTGKYDLVFYVTNELPKISINPNSILIVQFPFDGPILLGPNFRSVKRILRRKLLVRNKGIIVYSEYVASWVKAFWGQKSKVIHPFVETTSFKPGEKINQILAVGRFSPFGHNKKQLELIRIFKKANDQGHLRDVSFLLIGGVLDQDEKFYNKLNEEAHGYNITLRKNVSFDELQKSYAESKVFWHATGFKEDTGLHPERVEHFGISTIEAMASGCVPVVINLGGQKEIVEDGKNGLLWNSEKELIYKTELLFHDKLKMRKFQEQALVRSGEFDKEKFQKNLKSFLSRLGYEA